MTKNSDNSDQGSYTPPGDLKNKGQNIDAADVEVALRMLKTYLDPQDIADLLAALENLLNDPLNETHQSKVVEAFNSLKGMQGAVLTYAPYLNVFVSDDPFGER